MKFFLHVVGFSSLPLVVVVSVVGLIVSLLFFVKYGVVIFFFFRLVFLVFNIILWMKDVIIEGVSGYHNKFVDVGFKYGFIIFIFTEVMFFFSIFWFFFDKFFFGLVWWPVDRGLLDCWGLPLFGTILLLSRGLTCTWAHGVMNNKIFEVLMLLTLFLGFIFLVLQFYEYCVLPFDMRDGVYGRLFFFFTGFHGLHVVVGVVLLSLSLIRFKWGVVCWNNYFFFEGSAVYWHFVDVVWLLLFLVVYV